MNPSASRSPWPTDKALYVAYALRGYVYNDRRARVANVRLRIEQLDASARPVATRAAWVAGTLSHGDRRYFETAVPAAGAAYRVSIESFNYSGCGDG